MGRKTVLERVGMLITAGVFAAMLVFARGHSQETGESTPTNTTADAIANHLNENLPRDMFANFGLFVYVDKAERGPFAQRMFVFRKSGDSLALIYEWPVSTGREALERDTRGKLQATITPVGYYELDPKRQFIKHVSSQWKEDMPYAMFLDWKPMGHVTGLAIHGARGDGAASLGTRASAGCVRLSEESARTLFKLVQEEFRGSVPIISYFDGDRSESSEGFLLHGTDGQIVLHDGYSVLVVVDDYVGEVQVGSLF